MSRKFAISIIKVSYTNDKAKRQRYSGCCSGSRLFILRNLSGRLSSAQSHRSSGGYTKK